MVINYKGTEYELSSSLRVAYKIQGQNGHKSYTEVFRSITTMPIEQQIYILYVAFAIANPEDAKKTTQAEFLDYFLDTYNVGQLMDMLNEVISGILGKELTDKAKELTDRELRVEVQSSKNV